MDIRPYSSYNNMLDNLLANVSFQPFLATVWLLPVCFTSWLNVSTMFVVSSELIQAFTIVLCNT